MIYFFIILLIIIILSIYILAWFITFITNVKNIYFPEFSDIKTNCKYRRWGCCKDNITPKLDQDGTNCRGF
jgi:hypothetical protein